MRKLCLLTPIREVHVCSIHPSDLSLIWSLVLWVSIFQRSWKSQQHLCRGQPIMVFANFLIATFPYKHCWLANFLGGNTNFTFKSCLGNVWGGKVTDAIESRVWVKVVLCGFGYVSDCGGCRYLWLQYCVEYITQTMSNLILACMEKLFMIFSQFIYSILYMNF